MEAGNVVCRYLHVGKLFFFLLEPRQSVATIVVDQQAMVIRKIYPNLATNQILSLNF